MGPAGRHVGEHGDHTLSAEGHHRDDLVIVSGIEVDLVRTAHQLQRAEDVGEVAAGFLYAHDVLLVLHELRDGLGGDIAAGPAGYIVEDDRDGHCFRSLGEMAVQSLLGRLVVVRGHQEKSVRAAALRLHGKIDRGLSFFFLLRGDGRGDHIPV